MPNPKCSRCNGTGREPNENTTGKQRRAARMAEKFKMCEVAEAMGIAESYLSALENGHRHWTVKLIENNQSAIKRLIIRRLEK